MKNLFCLVPREGLEPSRPNERLILSQLRLPLRHLGFKIGGPTRICTETKRVRASCAAVTL